MSTFLAMASSFIFQHVNFQGIKLVSLKKLHLVTYFIVSENSIKNSSSANIKSKISSEIYCRAFSFKGISVFVACHKIKNGKWSPCRGILKKAYQGVNILKHKCLLKLQIYTLQQNSQKFYEC